MAGGVVRVLVWCVRCVDGSDRRVGGIRGAYGMSMGTLLGAALQDFAAMLTEARLVRSC
jgi:hypothetical protein